LEQSIELIKADVSKSIAHLAKKVQESEITIENFEELDKKDGSASSNNNGSSTEGVIRKKIGKKGKNKICKKSITVLKNWLTEHYHDPYPNHEQKVALAEKAGISFKQVSDTFVN